MLRLCGSVASLALLVGLCEKQVAAADATAPMAPAVMNSGVTAEVVPVWNRYYGPRRSYGYGYPRYGYGGYYQPYTTYRPYSYGGGYNYDPYYVPYYGPYMSRGPVIRFGWY